MNIAPLAWNSVLQGNKTKVTKEQRMKRKQQYTEELPLFCGCKTKRKRREHAALRATLFILRPIIHRLTTLNTQIKHHVEEEI